MRDQFSTNSSASDRPLLTPFMADAPVHRHLARRPGTVVAGATMFIISGCIGILGGLYIMAAGAGVEYAGVAGIIVIAISAGFLALTVAAMRGSFGCLITLTVLTGLSAFGVITQPTTSSVLGLIWSGIALALMYSGRSWYDSLR